MGQQLERAQTQLEAETQSRQEIQQAQTQLMGFLQLAEGQQAQAQLRQQLEEAQRQLQAQKENFLAEQARLEARTKELQAAQAEVEQKVKFLTERLATENQHPQGGEQEAGTIGKSRSELEAELAENRQIQARLRQQLEETQKQLEALGRKRLASNVSSRHRLRNCRLLRSL